MDRESFIEIVEFGCGVTVNRIVWINKISSEYVWFIGLSISHKNQDRNIIMEFDSDHTIEQVLEKIANVFYMAFKG